MTDRRPSTRDRAVAAVRRLPWWVLVTACLTVGLAPLRPRPHLVEKVDLLLGGDRLAAIDVADLALHATPWVLLAVRVVADVAHRRAQGTPG